MSMDETTDGSVPEMVEPRRGSRRAAIGLAGVMAFALVVAAVAVLAARGGGTKSLPVLPALHNANADANSAAAGTGTGTAAMAPAGPVTYQLQGTLPALPDHAPAYRLSGSVTAAAVSKLAAALGLKGTPQPMSNQWILQDGTRLLMVGTDAGSSWVYTADSHCAPVQSSVAGIACAATGSGVATSGSGVATSGSGVATSGPGVATPGPAAAPPAAPASTSAVASSPPAAPAPPPSVPAGTSPSCPMPPCSSGACPRFCVAPPVCALEANGTCPGVSVPSRPADAPTVQEAEGVARGLLGRLGVDAANAAITTVETATGWQVEISPQVGGLPTEGYVWSVDVGPKGAIDGAGGKLAAPTLIGSYPLIGVQAGFDRLKAGNSGLGGVTPMVGAPGLACPEPATTAAGPGTAPGTGSGPAPVCEPRIVTVTGAKLALGLAVSSTEAVLEPIYLFQLAGGGGAAVVATVDRLVAPPTAIARVEPPGSAVPAKPLPLPVPAPAGTQTPAPPSQTANP